MRVEFSFPTCKFAVVDICSMWNAIVKVYNMCVLILLTPYTYIHTYIYIYIYEVV